MFEQNQPIEKDKSALKRIFNKVSEMAARAAVTSTLKIGVTSVLVGMGVSALATAGAAVLTTGVGAALYSYGSDFIKAKRRARAEGLADGVAFWDRDRAKRARLALLAGVAGGALGSWLAGTDTFQSGFEYMKETGGKASGWLSGLFGHAASPQPSVMAAPVIPPAVSPLPEVSHEAVAQLSPQQMKDAAHDILRDKSMPWAERLKLARSLATEAKLHGNRQAVQFLKDLVMLEKGAGISKAAEAATCVISKTDLTGAFDVACNAHSPTMRAGDYIGFADAENADIKARVFLTKDSVSIPTKDFLNPAVIADGVEKMKAP